jgi:glycyl-tRNA synthetase
VCTPFVIEPALGLNRLLLAMFCDGLREETLPDGSARTVFRCAPALAPVAANVLPLLKRSPQVEAAEALHARLLALARVGYDAAGSIGARYRRGDEEGTPLCITVDGGTAADGAVTLRDRDSMRQVRVSIEEVVARAEQRKLLPSTWFGGEGGAGAAQG